MSIETGQIVNRVVDRHLVPHRYDGEKWVPIAIDAAQVAALKAEGWRIVKLDRYGTAPGSSIEEEMGGTYRPARETWTVEDEL